MDESFDDRGNDVIRALNDLGERDQAKALRLLRTAGFEAIP